MKNFSIHWSILSCCFFAKYNNLRVFQLRNIDNWTISWYNLLGYFILLPHKVNYVVLFFLTIFSIAKVQVFEFVCGVSRPFPSYKFSLCLRCYDRGCLQGAQCPFASCNKCVQKDALNYGGILFLSIFRLIRRVFSYQPIYLTCQEVYHSGSQTRSRFLCYSPGYIPLTFCKALLAR